MDTSLVISLVCTGLTFRKRRETVRRDGHESSNIPGVYWPYIPERGERQLEEMDTSLVISLVCTGLTFRKRRETVRRDGHESSNIPGVYWPYIQKEERDS